MSNRDLAISIVKELPDEQINAFLVLFADENMRARLEADAIATNLTRKRYNSFDEMAKEILSDE